MDGISAALTVWNVIQTTKVIIEFLKSVKDADKDRLRLIRELDTTTKLLENIHGIADSNPEILKDLSNGSFDEYQRLVSELRDKAISAHGIKDLAKKLRFVSGRSDVQDLFHVLERYKSNFALLLASENLQISLDNKATLEGMNPKFESVKLDAGQMDELRSLLAVSLHPSEPVKGVPAPMMVPFNRDLDDLVSRNTYLDRVDHLFENSKRVALFGLGGIGKSRLAVEYLYRIRDAHPNTSVFWTYAADESHFLTSYNKILPIIPKDFQMTHTTSTDRASGQQNWQSVLIKDWLENDRSGRWLLIVDNADDYDTFVKNRSTKSLLPARGDGRLLITSRSKEVALGLVGSDRNLIPVEFLSEMEAISLFRLLLPGDNTPEDMLKALLQSLEFLPLAIKQAAAYISATSISATEYLRMFQDESNQQQLLSEDFSDLSRDYPDVQNAVILTWQVSLQQIQSRSSSAADLMAFMSVLSREAIHKTIFRTYWISDLQMTRDLGILRSFSFISPSSLGQGVFVMHRLVQMTIRVWLQKHDQLRKWETEALQILGPLFARALEAEDWALCQMLYPHARLLSKASHLDATTQRSREDVSNFLHVYENPPLDQLSSQTSTSIYESTLGLRLAPRSTDWLFCHPIFQKWYQNEFSTLLLVGRPGSGKTVLSTHLIASLMPEDSLTLSFFFSFRNNSDDPTADMLRHLLFQISSALDSLTDSVRQISLAKKEVGEGHSQLIAAFKEALDKFDRPVSIIIDGLDECPESAQQDVYDILLQLAKGVEGRHCRCLITSRPAAFFSAVKNRDQETSIDLNVENTSALVKFVEDGLNSGRLATLQEDLKQKMVKTIIETGSFFSARLMLDGSTEYQAAELIDAMFKQDASLAVLKAGYLTALEQFIEPWGIYILRWTMYSFRPLTLKEMTEAANLAEINEAVRIKENPVTTELYGRRSIVSKATSNLVNANAKDENLPVRFLHPSVREFFETCRAEIPKKFHLDESECHEMLFTRCLEALLLAPSAEPEESHLEARQQGSLPQTNAHDDKTSQVTNPVTNTRPTSTLLPYAAKYWPTHWKESIRTREPSPKMLSLLENLFDPQNPQAFEDWLRVWNAAQPEDPPPTQPYLSERDKMRRYIKFLNLPIDVKGAPGNSPSGSDSKPQDSSTQSQGEDNEALGDSQTAAMTQEGSPAKIADLRPPSPKRRRSRSVERIFSRIKSRMKGKSTDL